MARAIRQLTSGHQHLQSRPNHVNLNNIISSDGSQSCSPRPDLMHRTLLSSWTHAAQTVSMGGISTGVWIDSSVSSLFQRQSPKPERIQEAFICDPDEGCHSISSSTQTTLECLNPAKNSSWMGTCPVLSARNAQKNISLIC